jgi:6-pyruvoyltetrahydropterin/6-carboxytetrahydropterin synthase
MARNFSTKTYGNDRGFSCCFRQWKATHSHCSLMHGYSLGFRFTFEAEQLDERNWVQDFGGLKEVKAWLDTQFDHTTVIAEDDPMLDRFKAMAGWSNNPELDGKPDEVQQHPHPNQGVIDLRIVPAVGCEAFAQMVYDHVSKLMIADPTNRYTNLLGDEHPRVLLKSVEVFEHSGNSAIYEG